MGFVGKIFGSSAVKETASAVIDSVGNAIDKVFTSKEEKAQAMLEIEKETNRHMEQLETNILKEFELEVQDRSSARSRESEFVKSTGHMDYLMWFLAVSAIGVFGYMVFMVLTGRVKEANENLLFYIVGTVQGVVLSIFNYYFGSSAGSRIKDMRGK